MHLKFFIRAVILLCASNSYFAAIKLLRPYQHLSHKPVAERRLELLSGDEVKFVGGVAKHFLDHFLDIKEDGTISGLKNKKELRTGEDEDEDKDKEILVEQGNIKLPYNIYILSCTNCYNDSKRMLYPTIDDFGKEPIDESNLPLIIENINKIKQAQKINDDQSILETTIMSEDKDLENFLLMNVTLATSFTEHKIYFIIVRRGGDKGKIVLAAQLTPLRKIGAPGSNDKELSVRIFNKLIESEIKVKYYEHFFESTKEFIDKVALDFEDRRKQIVEDISTLDGTIKSMLEYILTDPSPDISMEIQEPDYWKPLLRSNYPIYYMVLENSASGLDNKLEYKLTATNYKHFSDLQITVEMTDNGVTVEYNTEYGDITDTLNFPTVNVILTTIESRTREIIYKMLLPIHILEQRAHHSTKENKHDILNDVKGYFGEFDSNHSYKYSCEEITQKDEYFSSLNIFFTKEEKTGESTVKEQEIVVEDDIKEQNARSAVFIYQNTYNQIQVDIDTETYKDTKLFSSDSYYPLDIYIRMLVDKVCYYIRMLGKPKIPIGNDIYKDSNFLFVPKEAVELNYIGYDYFIVKPSRITANIEDKIIKIVDVPTYGLEVFKGKFIDKVSEVPKDEDLTKTMDNIEELDNLYNRRAIYQTQELKAKLLMLRILL